MTQPQPVSQRVSPHEASQSPSAPANGLGETLRRSVAGVVDVVLFLAVLAFTGVAMIAVAIVAPLAVGISAIIGRPHRRRSSWRPAKAG